MPKSVCVKNIKVNKALYLGIFTQHSGFFFGIFAKLKTHSYFTVAAIFVLYPLPYRLVSYLHWSSAHIFHYFQQVTNINIGSCARHPNVMIME